MFLGGYFLKCWVGMCGPLAKILTLFMAKICVFATLFMTCPEFNGLFVIVTAGTVAPNISYEGLLLRGLSIKMKRQLLLRNIPNSRLEC